MKKGAIMIVVLLALVAGTWAYFRTTHSYHFGNWKSSADTSDSMQWIPFTWVGDSIGNRYFDKLAMFVPVTIVGIPGQFQCQFDNGSNITMLYDDPINSLASRYPRLHQKLDCLASKKDTVCYIKDLRLKIGDVTFESPEVDIYRGYGDPLSEDSLTPGGRKIGTVGVDICKDRILIIDYPHTRLCVAKQLDKQFKVRWTPITLDNSGRVILPMVYKGKPYKVLFDCGSSMFSLLASHRIVPQLAQAAPADTVAVPSWGKMLQVIGRPITDSFTIADIRFGGINVYSNDGAGEIVPEDVDAVTGNVLFLDKVIVIDFKNKRFGVMK